MDVLVKKTNVKIIIALVFKIRSIVIQIIAIAKTVLIHRIINPKFFINKDRTNLKKKNIANVSQVALKTIVFA